MPNKLSSIFKMPEMFIAGFSVICITILETMALAKGVDGIMFGSSMTGIGVIIGWVFKGYHQRLKKSRK
jgi:hypothetical protein